jgi:hypothetical protein
MTTEHKPEQWFWEAGSEECPHGAEPNVETDGDAWDTWRERHPSSDNGPICLDAPAGEACGDCSAEHGDMVPWSSCGTRTRARRDGQPKAGPIAHAPITVVGGSLECLELECDDFFDEDGDEIPGKTACSHLTELEICEGCTGPWKVGEFPPVVAWASCPQRLVKAEASA